MIATMQGRPPAADPRSLKPWDLVVVRPDAALPCGAPHPFRNMLATVVCIDPPDGGEDLTAMVHVPAHRLAAVMSAGPVQMDGLELLRTFPLRIFGFGFGDVVKPGTLVVDGRSRVFLELDRLTLRRSGKVQA